LISGLMPLGSDWWMAGPALNALGAIADEILLARDWSGRGFSGRILPEPAEIPDDVGGVARRKLRSFHGKFWCPGQNSKSTERSVRNALSWLAAGIDEPDRWLVSIDADEVVQEAEAFRAWLLAGPLSVGPRGARVFLRAIDVWKVIGDTALVMDHPGWMICVGTKLRGSFVRGRNTGEDGEIVSPVGRIVHWTMHRRTAADVRLKLSTYGHSDNLGPDRINAFVGLWESTTLENFHRVKAAIPYSPNGPWGLKPVPVAELGGLPAWAVTP
jgi:hypothetical protein